MKIINLYYLVLILITIPVFAIQIPESVLEELNQNKEADFFVVFKQQANLKPAHIIRSKEAKGQFVFEQLTKTARITQQPVKNWLDKRHVTYRSFWIQNMILVHGNETILNELSRMQTISEIRPNRHFQAIDPKEKWDFNVDNHPSDPPWNLTQIKAPDVWWDHDFSGEGIVVCDNDTGVMYDHPALKNQYRGFDGVAYDHNYNWFDATGTSLDVPLDDHSHGTHTTGSMVGDDGDTNIIGVAPGSKWIAVKNMDNEGSGTDEWFHASFEWILAPKDLTGSNPDYTKAPHVVNNSWGYAGGNNDFFYDDIAALRAAGIFVEVSAGNEGPACGSLRSPADYDNVFTTGSTNQGGFISGFSSRGPSALYPDIIKPDVVAPGNAIRSSVPGGGYQSMSGTSMAGPHTAGMVALLWSVNNTLIGDIDLTEDIIKNTAVVSLTDTCSGSSRDGNNVYGFGEINCLAAAEYALIPESEAFIKFDQTAYNCSDEIVLWVKDSDLIGDGSLEVSVVSATESSAEIVTLTEFTDGFFQGSILTNTDIPSSDGVLQVTDGDTVTMSYMDEIHGPDDNVELSKDAEIDCSEPLITNLNVHQLTSNSATITWQTNEPAKSEITYAESTETPSFTSLGRYNTQHTITLQELSECTDYEFYIQATDTAGNVAIDDNGGEWHTFQTYEVKVLFEEMMNSDPGWITEGDWEWGIPHGNAGDPTSGNTGKNVYGYNLDGAYENNIPEYLLISPRIDCSDSINTTVAVQMWVNVQATDKITWLVSWDDGTSWYTLWENNYPVEMNFWLNIEAELGVLLDGENEVRFAFGMGPTDDTGVAGGWNIDDFRIFYDAPCTGPENTPTPSPSPTPLNPGVRLDMPRMTHPGEDFYITGLLDNPDPPMSNVPVFFVLEVYGEFWFWPEWKYFNPPESEDIDFEIMDVPTGTREVSVLPNFVWPDTGPYTVNGLRFFGAMLDATMSGIYGNLAVMEWGYGPAE